MYYYKISIDTEYEGSDNMIVGHEERFTNFEFNTIVLECIDECVDMFCSQDEYKNKEPCYFNADDLFVRYYLPHLLRIRGFEICRPMYTCNIMNGRILADNEFKSSFLFERYKDKEIGQCVDCSFEGKRFFEGCPVHHKRRDLSE